MRAGAFMLFAKSPVETARTNLAAAKISTALRLTIVLLALLPGACGPSVPQVAPLPEGGLVVAFGDSLTFGTGARPEDSYPAVLERLIGRKVIRSGVPGELSANGLRRLAAVLERHRPDLLILCHGGNDFLRRKDRKALEANIRDMVKLAKSQGIDVLLIGVPEPGILITEGAEFYARIAEAFGIPYEGEVLADVLIRGGLKSDAIHPNGKGYLKVAEAVARLLRESGAI